VKTKFGWVEIDRVRYDHDVIIHADKTVTKRSKKKSKKMKNRYGHTPLADHELVLLEMEKPLVVYIGTGQYGDLPITTGAHEVLKEYVTIIRPTPDLMQDLEEEARPFVAILHVSC
jgi:hypothetical protein